MTPDRAAICMRFDIDTFSTRHAFTADVGWGEYQYIPKLLAIAHQSGAPLQFCGCGQGVCGYPAEHTAIARAGHAMDSHLYTHTVTLLDELAKIEEELILTERAFAEHKLPWTGIGATGMYSNGIDARADVQQLLIRRGYRWCSSKYKRERPMAQMQPYWLREGLLEIPCAGPSDRHHFYDAGAAIGDYISQVLSLMGQAAKNAWAYVICLHPGVLAKFDPRCDLIRAVITRAGELDLPLLTMEDIRQREIARSAGTSPKPEN